MSEKTFEEQMSRLEEIVSKLEKNETSLDDTIALFEEGLKLAKNCDDQLKSFELKISELSAKED